MARAVVTGHEANVMNTARKRVLPRASGPNTPVLVVVLPGSRCFITVVTFTYVSDPAVSVTKDTCIISRGAKVIYTLLWGHRELENGLRIHTKDRS